jgi:DNA-binding GntR family transcriptional regulator
LSDIMSAVRAVRYHPRAAGERVTTELQRPDTLTAAVAKHIRDAIVRGEYAPGSALPEVRLAEQLGTSRGTVREALRELDELGLVDIVPHRGSFVSAVTKAKARDLYELRSVLEGFAVRVAIERGHLLPAMRPAYDQLLDGMVSAGATEDPMAMIEAERSLHRAIWSRCDNRLLLDHLAQVQVQTRRLLLYNKAFTADPASEVRTHRALLDDVLSGDPLRAETAVRAHVRESAALVLARLPDPDADASSGRDADQPAARAADPPARGPELDRAPIASRTTR